MKNIQLLRMEIGVNQSIIADELGISRQYYQMIEAGERKPPQKIKEKLEHFFGLPVKILLQDKNYILEIMRG